MGIQEFLERLNVGSVVLELQVASKMKDRSESRPG
jgi:hypothetical protein